MNKILEPVYFDGANEMLNSPFARCQPSNMIAYRKDNEIASLWRLTLMQRLYVLFRGRICLHVLSPKACPYVCITCSADPKKEGWL